MLKLWLALQLPTVKCPHGKRRNQTKNYPWNNDRTYIYVHFVWNTNDADNKCSFRISYSSWNQRYMYRPFAMTSFSGHIGGKVTQRHGRTRRDVTKPIVIVASSEFIRVISLRHCVILDHFPGSNMAACDVMWKGSILSKRLCQQTATMFIHRAPPTGVASNTRTRFGFSRMRRNNGGHYTKGTVFHEDI